MLTRETLIEMLHDALEPLPDVDGAWIGGSAAFGNLDDYSDIDLVAIVADSSLDSTFAAIESALEAQSTILLRYQTPSPGGFVQRVYRLSGTSEFLLVEAALIPRSSSQRFLERELHGEPVVLFDKTGEVHSVPLDEKADLAEAKRRLETLKAGFAMFQILAKKEMARGHAAEALLFYQGFTLKPLVEALRIRHCPHRRAFHLRYIERDLPPDVASRLTDLSFVRDVEDLAAKREIAESWFWETVNAVDLSL